MVWGLWMKMLVSLEVSFMTALQVGDTVLVCQGTYSGTGVHGATTELNSLCWGRTNGLKITVMLL